MLFNSLNFAVFIPIVFILYWFVFNKKLRVQNLLLLAASYFFYGSWNWKFLFLLIFSTVLDYYIGIKIYESREKKRKKTWLIISVATNLGFLGFFKYYNFFANSFADFVGAFGLSLHPYMLHIILPVGISFYTFHGLSYVFDIYKGKIKPTRNFVAYADFVSFFPLLVAGPIERATHLLPQIKQRRKFDYTKAIDGCRQILWGLFKKIVIADQCATYVDNIYKLPESYSGSELLLAAFLFLVQIYCDFSGYSDIAIGTARLFGIDLMKNFAFPLFSRNMGEFWRKWHISLTSWFRDYVFFQLKGSWKRGWKRTRNIIIVFALTGLWHGANWTFILWGLLQVIYVIPSLIVRRRKHHYKSDNLFPGFKESLNIFKTFTLTTLGAILFRSINMPQALLFYKEIFSKSLFYWPKYLPATNLFLILVIFFGIEWYNRNQEYALEDFGFKWPKLVRWGMYYVMILIIFNYARTAETFIYFQF